MTSCHSSSVTLSLRSSLPRKNRETGHLVLHDQVEHRIVDTRHAMPSSGIIQASAKESNWSYKKPLFLSASAVPARQCSGAKGGAAATEPRA
jgi:hypothetical protein